MSRATLIKLLIVQTLLLVLVTWGGIYFARDEYLLATGVSHGDDDEGLTKAAAVSEEQGVPTVRLSPAAQRNVGIEVAMPEPGELGGEAVRPVLVQNPAPLAELQGMLRAARHALDAAHHQAAGSAAEQRRVQALYDDDRQASERALDAATAQAAGDTARERAAAATLAALREGAVASWGRQLARELDGDGSGLVARLSSGREVLLRALLRGDESVPPNARLALALPGRAGELVARPLGSAGPAQADDPGGGRGLLFHAESRGLLPGQRLSGQLRDPYGKPPGGVLVPASAIVWHAGQPWIYIRESNEPQDVYAPAPGSAAAVEAKAARAAGRVAAPGGAAPAPGPGDIFQRRAVPQARRAGDRWFLAGYAEDDPVVVRGAQVLLSEELKYQIRNENDD